MDKRVEQIFVDTGEEERKIGWNSDSGPIIKKGPFFELNEDLEINIKDDQEVSKFLADVIRYWHKKRRLFCHDNVWTRVEDSEGESVKEILPEEDWTFSYKTPSTCGGCVSAQRLLDKIFGRKDRCNRLPYMKYCGDRNYQLRFDLLKAFIEGGEEKVEEIKKAEAGKKAEREQKEAEEANERRLEAVLGMTDKEVPSAAHGFLLSIASQDRTQVMDLKVHNDVIVALALRKHWSGTSAIAHFSQVHVFANGASASREWQYRDHSGNENYRYSINSIGSIQTQKEGGELIVEVDLVNGNRYSNINHSFRLEVPEKSSGEHPKLSNEELTRLRKRIESERARIRKHLEEMRERKPRMLASAPGTADGYQDYLHPVVSTVTVLDTGVAYFITVEQIDHRTKYRQMRHELYVMKPGDEGARRVVEDHAYENVRNAFVRVININPDEVNVETPEGKKTISLKPVEA